MLKHLEIAEDFPENHLSESPPSDHEKKGFELEQVEHMSRQGQEAPRGILKLYKASTSLNLLRPPRPFPKPESA